MTKTIYKTRPKLAILIIPFLGAIFFALLFWLTFKNAKSELTLIPQLLMALFATISAISFFYTFNVKTIKLKTENIVISYLLLPVKKTLSFTDIESISQKTKDIYNMDNDSFASRYLYTDSITTFTLVNNK